MRQQASDDKVTMATIARLAGVTQPTVSRAFNHPEKLLPETLTRIMEAVRLTGYVPNMVAGSLATSKTRMLAAIVPSLSNVVYSGLAQRFIASVREKGYQTMLLESGSTPEEEERLVEMAIARRPDGIMLTGIDHTETCRTRLLTAGVPVAEVWDLTESPIDFCVGFSHEGSARAAARYLMNAGHAKLAVISASDERAARRERAFCDEVRARGLGPPMTHVLPGAASLLEGRHAFRALLARGFERGAIFCSSDLLAHGVMVEAALRGIQIPGQVAVLGFGDQQFAADIVPALSTVRIDRVALGAEAARMMIARIDGGAPDQNRVDIGFRIMERQTA